MSRARMSRREALGWLGGGAAAVGLGVLGWGYTGGERAGRLLTSEIELPEPFSVPLPLPEPIAPHRGGDDVDHYRLVQRAHYAEILPGVRTGVWGYDGRFPGPLFDVRADRRTRVHIRNELPVPTSTHLHGGVVRPESDGYPTDVTVPAGGGFTPHTGGHGAMEMSPEDWTFHEGAKTYDYPMRQRAATLWYHDHRMDFSGPQVWRGLAGMFIVRDAEERALPLPDGDREIPLLICDRAFTADGELAYPAKDPSLRRTPGVREEYMEGVEGDVNLVNGAPWPELEVAAARYRLRILNAANARRYRLALEPVPGENAPFVQVGGDKGLLPAPVEHRELTLAPAERCDVVVDFAAYPMGAEVRLVNLLERGRRREVMRFRVVRSGRDDSRVPKVLSEYRRLAAGDAVRTREFDFRLTRASGQQLWTINGKPFEVGRPLAESAAGSVERWRFTSDFHHPVHLHRARFQVLGRGGGAPGPMDAGWKDTVDVAPYEVVDTLVEFDRFRGRSMMHCHNLEHEDHAMMADFTIV